MDDEESVAKVRRTYGGPLPVSLSLRPDQVQELDAVALRAGCSRSYLVRVILEQALARVAAGEPITIGAVSA